MREYTLGVRTDGGLHGVRTIRIAGYDWKAAANGEISFQMTPAAIEALNAQLRCGVSFDHCGGCRGPRRGDDGRWYISSACISKCDQSLCPELAAALAAQSHQHA